MLLNFEPKVSVKFVLTLFFLYCSVVFLFSIPKEAKVPNFNGIDKAAVVGMSRSEFLEACTIEWIPIEKRHQQWETIDIDLSKHTYYHQFDSIVSKLVVSDIARAYKANVFTADGRSFIVLEIGNGTKIVSFTAGIHAREVANPQFLLKFASILVGGYEKGISKHLDLLKNYKVVFLLCANPDGYEAALLGKNAISNQSLFLSQVDEKDVFKAKSNANGVDINRNFPSYSASLLWRGVSESVSYIDSVPSINYFSGYKLGSEVETRVAMNFVMRYVPISCRFIDLHSAGRLVYAGKPHLSNSFNDESLAVANTVNELTKYKIRDVNSEDVGKGTDGTITDFAAEVAAGFAYNDVLGRIAPLKADSVIVKTNSYEYKCTINTIETLRTSKRDGFGLLKASTPKMQYDEWKLYKLENLFFALIVGK